MMWTHGERIALQDAAAFVSALIEPAGAPDADRLNEVLDAVVADLGRTPDTVLATAFGVLATMLLDRLASATGRSREELWEEIAGEITAVTVREERP